MGLFSVVFGVYFRSLCSVELHGTFQGSLLQLLPHLLLFLSQASSEQSPCGWSLFLDDSVRAKNEFLEGDCHHSVACLGQRLILLTTRNCCELSFFILETLLTSLDKVKSFVSEVKRYIIWFLKDGYAVRRQLYSESTIKPV